MCVYSRPLLIFNPIETITTHIIFQPHLHIYSIFKAVCNTWKHFVSSFSFRAIAQVRLKVNDYSTPDTLYVCLMHAFNEVHLNRDLSSEKKRNHIYFILFIKFIMKHEMRSFVLRSAFHHLFLPLEHHSITVSILNEWNRKSSAQNCAFVDWFEK